MKIYRMNWFIKMFTKAWVWGQTIPPIGIFLRDGHENDPRLLAHEKVHWAQYEQMGLIRFYLTYWYYLIRYGYTNNPMEVEAREKSGIG